MNSLLFEAVDWHRWQLLHACWQRLLSNRFAYEAQIASSQGHDVRTLTFQVFGNERLEAQHVCAPEVCTNPAQT